MHKCMYVEEEERYREPITTHGVARLTITLMIVNLTGKNLDPQCESA